VLKAACLCFCSVRPAPQEGWFFSISSTASGSQANITCNVSDVELRLIKNVLDVRA
jgi:hypothetical protein